MMSLPAYLDDHTRTESTKSNSRHLNAWGPSCFWHASPQFAARPDSDSAKLSCGRTSNTVTSPYLDFQVARRFCTKKFIDLTAMLDTGPTGCINISGQKHI